MRKEVILVIWRNVIKFLKEYIFYPYHQCTENKSDKTFSTKPTRNRSSNRGVTCRINGLTCPSLNSLKCPSLYYLLFERHDSFVRNESKTLSQFAVLLLSTMCRASSVYREFLFFAFSFSDNYLMLLFRLPLRQDFFADVQVKFVKSNSDHCCGLLFRVLLVHRIVSFVMLCMTVWIS